MTLPRVRPRDTGSVCYAKLGSKLVIVANYKMHVFIEVPVRPCMLPKLHDPRRSHVAPGNPLNIPQKRSSISIDPKKSKLHAP